MTDYLDIQYAEVDGHALFLDIFTPDDVENPPLVMYIHGGGWRNGDYKGLRMEWLPQHGYAVASIGYHLTDKKIFPQQIFDAKGALRWLKAHADTYGFDKDRIAVAGGSAGGQLASLLGVSSHLPELEGDVAGHLDQDNTVKAIVNYYGPVDLLDRHKTDPMQRERPSFVYLDGPKTGEVDWNLTRLATAVALITEQAPPIITIHGEADDLVPVKQAQCITRCYKELGLVAELYTDSEAGHGDQVLFEDPYRQHVLNFLNTYL